MSSHPTPLSAHIRKSEFWIDTLLLAVLWLTAHFLELLLTDPRLAYVIKLVQITALMASIEYIGFFALHLFGRSKGLFIQGFFGGLISSTMMFIQLGDSGKTKGHSPIDIARTLLLATIAMLLLGVVIVYTLADAQSFQLALPLFIQSGTLLAVVVILGLQEKMKPSQESEQLVMIDDPIVWKNVLKFTVFLASILLIVKAVTKMIPESYLLSTFIIALFETHAILAAAMTNLSTISEAPKLVILTIMFGNIVSKIFLVAKGQVHEAKRPVILSLAGSFLAALLSLVF